MSDAITRLADRLAIDDQLTRYCRAIDTGAWDLLDDVFTPDAVVDYTSSGGQRGAYREIKAWLASVLPSFAMRQHLVTNREGAIDAERSSGRPSGHAAQSRASGNRTVNSLPFPGP